MMTNSIVLIIIIVLKLSSFALRILISPGNFTTIYAFFLIVSEERFLILMKPGLLTLA